MFNTIISRTNITVVWYRVVPTRLFESHASNKSFVRSEVIYISQLNTVYILKVNLTHTYFLSFRLIYKCYASIIFISKVTDQSKPTRGIMSNLSPYVALFIPREALFSSLLVTHLLATQSPQPINCVCDAIKHIPAYNAQRDIGVSRHHGSHRTYHI